MVMSGWLVIGLGVYTWIMYRMGFNEAKARRKKQDLYDQDRKTQDFYDQDQIVI